MKSCCKALINYYLAIDPTYPREGAALWCAKSQTRLVYCNGKWKTKGT